MNIRIIFYSLFRSPVQKSVRCPSFFFFKLFATGNPDRKFWLKKNKDSPKIATFLPGHDRTAVEVMLP